MSFLNNFEGAASLVPVVGANAWALAAGTCRGGPCEERPGLPSAGHSQFQEVRSNGRGTAVREGGSAPWQRRCSLKGAASSGRPTTVQRKTTRKKEQQRDTAKS